MNKKIIEIVVLILVATMVVSAININAKGNIQTKASGVVSYCNNKIDSYKPTYEPTLFDFGVDQKQKNQDGSGCTLQPPFTFAQSFIPTKDKLTAVSLYIFNYYIEIPVLITVSIRDSLIGSDLVTKTIDTNLVTIDVTWVLFDFEDISVNPGSQYFIVCSGNAGDDINGSYCWFYANNGTYTRGEGFIKQNDTADWIKLHQYDPTFGDVDFCFKTYFQKPLISSAPINNEVTMPVSYNIPFLSFWEQLFERLPRIFPVHRHLLG